MSVAILIIDLEAEERFTFCFLSELEVAMMRMVMKLLLLPDFLWVTSMNCSAAGFS